LLVEIIFALISKLRVKEKNMIDLVKNYSGLARRMKKSVIRELLKLTHKPEIISFAGGLPDPGTFPVEEIAEITQEILSKNSRVALQYGSTEGNPLLKDEIVKLSKDENINITHDNILITVASQQGLDLLSKVFVDVDDPVIVELPSYVGGLQALNSYGAKLIGVPTDDDGIKVDILERKIQELKEEGEHYKIIYVVPDFQNPSGVTLSFERRKKLIDIAEKFSILIFEDTPYRELRYDGVEPPSLYSLDNSGNVVSLHTFSKILVPGFRLGWVVAHPEIIKKLAIAKQSSDLCTPEFTQVIAAEYCRRGLLEPHIEMIKKCYKLKKDCMLHALQEYMPQVEGLRWTKPEGGLFLWLTLPSFMDADAMFVDAISHNVAYVVGSAFHCDNSGKNTMRLNFSYPSEAQIDEGIKRLAEVIKEQLVLHHAACK
jgi:2-aminoadipate transaminase